MRDNDRLFVSLVLNGHLTVFNDGRVLNCKTERLIGFTASSGYQRVGYLHEERVRFIFTHRLVYLIHGSLPLTEDYQVNHIDGVKTNNHISNLERCTASENIQHAHDMGLKDVHRGVEHVNSKLEPDDVLFIRSQYGEMTMRKLADAFGVSPTVIHRIVHRKSYQEVQP